MGQNLSLGIYITLTLPHFENGCDVVTSAVVDTTFVDIYVDTKNIPTCRYNIQHINKRTMEKKVNNQDYTPHS